jgi:hypothetical protein
MAVVCAAIAVLTAPPALQQVPAWVRPKAHVCTIFAPTTVSYDDM